MENTCELMIIVSPASLTTVALEEKDKLLLGRVGSTQAEQPDIDFTPDRGVSRKHAHLFFENGDWWIQDRSTTGTFLDGQELAEGKHKVEIGDPVGVGKNTLWTLANNTLKKMSPGDNLHIHFQLLPAINHAAARAGLSLIRKLNIINISDHFASQSLKINLSISTGSNEWRAPIVIGSLRERSIYKHHHKQFREKHPDGELIYPRDYYKFLKTNPMPPAMLVIEANYNGSAIRREYEIEVDGFYEWRYHRAYRTSLAAFVLYWNASVKKLVGAATKAIDAGENLGEKVNAAQVTALIYDYMEENFICRYQPPPYLSEKGKQKILPPEEMIKSWPKNDKKGQLDGTCLDLALLMAACLERLAYEPLIVIIEESQGQWHALLGCWQKPENILKRAPIIKDRAALLAALDNEQILFWEATACTDRRTDNWQGPLPFSAAKAAASRTLRESKLVFALDICAAREIVQPLIAEMPQDIKDIYDNAARIAAGQGHERLESRHLLWSILYSRDKTIMSMLEKAGGSRQKLEEKLVSLKPLDLRIDEIRQFHKSFSFKSAYPHSERLVAECRDATHVDKLFLLYALILAGGKSIDRMLKTINSSRYNLLTILNDYFEIRCRGDISHSLDEG